jgi:hypothetical protein
METPDNEAGRFTERVMERVRLVLPALTTADRNRIYESVLAEASITLAGRPRTPLDVAVAVVARMKP